MSQQSSEPVTAAASLSGRRKAPLQALTISKNDSQPKSQSPSSLLQIQTKPISLNPTSPRSPLTLLVAAPSTDNLHTQTQQNQNPTLLQTSTNPSHHKSNVINTNTNTNHNDSSQNEQDTLASPFVVNRHAIHARSLSNDVPMVKITEDMKKLQLDHQVQTNQPYSAPGDRRKSITEHKSGGTTTAVPWRLESSPRSPLFERRLSALSARSDGSNSAIVANSASDLLRRRSMTPTFTYSNPKMGRILNVTTSNNNNNNNNNNNTGGSKSPSSARQRFSYNRSVNNNSSSVNSDNNNNSSSNNNNNNNNDDDARTTATTTTTTTSISTASSSYQLANDPNDMEECPSPLVEEDMQCLKQGAPTEVRNLLEKRRQSRQMSAMGFVPLSPNAAAAILAKDTR